MLKIPDHPEFARRNRTRSAGNSPESHVAKNRKNGPQNGSFCPVLAAFIGENQCSHTAPQTRWPRSKSSISHLGWKARHDLRCGATRIFLTKGAQLRGAGAGSAPGTTSLFGSGWVKVGNPPDSADSACLGEGRLGGIFAHTPHRRPPAAERRKRPFCGSPAPEIG